MYWKDCEKTMTLLRLKIYNAVPDATIMYFIADHPDVAEALAQTGGKVETVIELWRFKEDVTRFLELIDGDSMFKIEWYRNDWNELECKIKCTHMVYVFEK